MQEKGLTQAGAIGMVKGSVQVAVLALAALGADLVVLPLDMVVTEGACIDVHSVLAGSAILHGMTPVRPCLQLLTKFALSHSSMQDRQVCVSRSAFCRTESCRAVGSKDEVELPTITQESRAAAWPKALPSFLLYKSPCQLKCPA